MTDWLNVEEVRADKAALEASPCCQACLTNWPATTAKRVLEAIAELPEPERCEAIPQPDGTMMVKAIDIDSTLHRIWRIARIVCGKEAQP